MLADVPLQYNDEPFTVLRPDSSITYIPRRFVPELERLKNDTIDPRLGQVIVSHPIEQQLEPPRLRQRSYTYQVIGTRTQMDQDGDSLE